MSLPIRTYGTVEATETLRATGVQPAAAPASDRLALLDANKDVVEGGVHNSTNVPRTANASGIAAADVEAALAELKADIGGATGIEVKDLLIYETTPIPGSFGEDGQYVIVLDNTSGNYWLKTAGTWGDTGISADAIRELATLAPLKPNATPSVGSSVKVAREDHVHEPSDEAINAGTAAAAADTKATSAGTAAAAAQTKADANEGAIAALKNVKSLAITVGGWVVSGNTQEFAVPNSDAIVGVYEGSDQVGVQPVIDGSGHKLVIPNGSAFAGSVRYYG